MDLKFIHDNLWFNSARCQVDYELFSFCVFRTGHQLKMNISYNNFRNKLGF